MHDAGATVADNVRPRDIDPLLASSLPLAGPDGDHRITASDALGTVTAVARFTQRDATSPEALWGALRQHTLEVQAAGTDPATALGTVLDSWLANVRATVEPGDDETSLQLSVPSRDTALIKPLLERGFAPSTVQAVRLLPREPASAPPHMPTILHGAAVRIATADDAVALGRLDAALLASEAQYGGVSVRAGADQIFAAAHTQRLESASNMTWVLEREGQVTGFVYVRPHAVVPKPGLPAVTLPGGHDLVVMYIDPGERGAGLGAAFAGIVHDTLDASGNPFIALSYSVANPRSGPFWSRMGYRPLLTRWQRRPAVLAEP